MSDLADRDQVELDFARKMVRLSNRQKRELKEQLGDPPDISRVSESDWRRWEVERQQELLDILLLIWLASTEQNATEQAVVVDVRSSNANAVRSGLQWCSLQSRQMAKDAIRGTRDILSSASEAWRGISPSKQTVDAILAQAFSPVRDAVLAVTATTMAVTHGVVQVVDLMTQAGASVEMRWMAEKDGRICAACGKRDNKPQSKWGSTEVASLTAMPGSAEGPPLHPNCRCWLKIVVT